MINSDDFTGIISFGLIALLVFLFAIAFAARYRKRKREHAGLKAKFEAELQKVKNEIQEQLLGNIGRELHDNLGHTASLIKIHVNTIDRSSLSNEVSEKISQTKDLLRQLILDIKTLSLQLNTDRVIQQGFLSAIECEVELLNKTGAFQVKLIVEDEFEAPRDEKALILFRMVQEGISNIIKHSKATVIDLKCYCSGTNSILELHDNGIGFNETACSLNGSGLINLRSRAQLINAFLQIESRVGKGTCISIHFPLEQ